MMKWTLVGKLIDVGDLPAGRGIVVEVGDKIITITGLEKAMVSWLAPSYGEDIAIGFNSADEVKRISSPTSPTHE
jgi:hypothetical protein